VAEGVETTAPIQADPPTLEEVSFFTSLALTAQPSRDLFALYQGWVDCVAALAAARITGRFGLLGSQEQAEADVLPW